MKPGQAIGHDRRVGMPDVGFGVHIVQRGRQIKPLRHIMEDWG